MDDYTDKAVKVGGKVLQPKEHLSTVGDIALIADPEGNPVGIIRPEEM